MLLSGDVLHGVFGSRCPKRIEISKRQPRLWTEMLFPGQSLRRELDRHARGQKRTRKRDGSFAPRSLSSSGRECHATVELRCQEATIGMEKDFWSRRLRSNCPELLDKAFWDLHSVRHSFSFWKDQRDRHRVSSRSFLHLWMHKSQDGFQLHRHVYSR